MHKKPKWLPDWRNVGEYPDPKTASLQQWAWEFLRRNHSYQKDYAEFENMIRAEILRQEKNKTINSETAQILLQGIEEHGRDCLLPPSCCLATNDLSPEPTLCLPWWIDPTNQDNLFGTKAPPQKTTASFEETWNKPTPAIIEPPCSRWIRTCYGITATHNPARNSAPLFTDNQTTDSVIPYAVIGSALHPEFLQAESENEIIFKLDVQKPLDEQLDFISRMYKSLKIQSGKRNSKPKTTRWLNLLRLLDSLDDDECTNSKETLAIEWGVTPNNLTKMHLDAKKLRDGGYRKIVTLEKGTSPELHASLLEFARGCQSIDLHDDLPPEEYKLYVEELKRKALKGIADGTKQNISKKQ